MSAKITVTKDTASPVLRSLYAGLSKAGRKPFMTEAGRSLERVFKKHFRERENDKTTKRAQAGWPKQHFWQKRVSDQMQPIEATDTTATLRIASREFAAKLYGATIRPGPGKKALTIPMRGEVYGRRASANPVPGLFVYRSKRGKAFLAAEQDGELTLYYRLVREVNQKADKNAMPPEKEIQAALDADLTRFVNRLMDLS